MIAIIDYGAGNLRSVEKAVLHVGGDVQVVNSPAGLQDATKLILPGVGAFGYAMDRLDRLEFRAVITDMVQSGTPLLGICLGKQLLMETSEESPGARGFGFIPGRVVRFPSTEKVPHIGWNQAQFQRTPALLREVPDGSYFYFVHSYYAQPTDPAQVIATSDYGTAFPCIIGNDHVWGVQFHPEKSQTFGLQLLQNFVEL